MAYRSGTYVAFHAGGTSDQSQSDIKYYRTLQMWHDNKDIDFTLINSHEKTYQVRDSSERQTLANRILERLRNSRNFLLIVTATTANDTDWVPYEITKAIDEYKLPLIIAYPEYNTITNPAAFTNWWPEPLKKRIELGVAKAIHIPFRLTPIKDALANFDVNNVPQWSNTIYPEDYYRRVG